MKMFAKILKKAGLMVMAAAAMISMNACGRINNDIANDVCNALSAKYGESFVAFKIGNRFHSNSAKLYVRSADGQGVVFEARIDKKTGAVTDNYVRQCVSHSMERCLDDELRKAGVICGIDISVLCENTDSETNTKLSVKAFSEKYEMSDVFFQLVISSNALDKEALSVIVSTLMEFKKQLGVTVSGFIYCVEDGSYRQCLEDMGKTPTISDTWLDFYDCTAKVAVWVEDDGVVPGIDEIARKLMGE